MRMKKNPNTIYSILGFMLVCVYTLCSLFFGNWYTRITTSYFSFLEKTGYYTYLYNEDCYSHCALSNLLHNAPYIFLVFLPALILFGVLYYFLSDDKKTFKKISSLFTNSTRKIPSIDLHSRKQRYFLKGIIIAFLTLIFLVFVFPLLFIIIDGILYTH